MTDKDPQDNSNSFVDELDIQDCNFDTSNRESCMNYIDKAPSGSEAFQLWETLEEVYERKNEDGIREQLENTPIGVLIEEMPSVSIADIVVDKWLRNMDRFNGDYFDFLKNELKLYRAVLSHGKESDRASEALPEEEEEEIAIKKFRNEVTALTKENKYKEALVINKEALKQFPNDPSLLMALGSSANMEGEYQEALDAWIKAFDVACDFNVAKWCMTNITSISERMGESTEDVALTKCEFCTLKAKELEEMGRKNDALKMYKEALKIAEEHNNIYLEQIKGCIRYIEATPDQIEKCDALMKEAEQYESDKNKEKALEKWEESRVIAYSEDVTTICDIHINGLTGSVRVSNIPPPPDDAEGSEDGENSEYNEEDVEEDDDNGEEDEAEETEEFEEEFDIEALTNELEEYKELAKSTEKRALEFEKNAADLDEQLKEANERISTLEAEKRELEKDLADIKQKEESERDKVEKKGEEIKKLKSEIFDGKERIEELEKERDDLAEKMDTLLKENGEQKLKIDELEGEREEHKNNSEFADTVREDAEKRASNLEEKLATIEEEKLKAITRAEDAESQLRISQDKIIALEEDGNTTDNELKSAKNEVAQLSRENGKLVDNIDDLKAQLEIAKELARTEYPKEATETMPAIFEPLTVKMGEHKRIEIATSNHIITVEQGAKITIGQSLNAKIRPLGSKADYEIIEGGYEIVT